VANEVYETVLITCFLLRPSCEHN